MKYFEILLFDICNKIFKVRALLRNIKNQINILRKNFNFNFLLLIFFYTFIKNFQFSIFIFYKKFAQMLILRYKLLKIKINLSYFIYYSS